MLTVFAGECLLKIASLSLCFQAKRFFQQLIKSRSVNQGNHEAMIRIIGKLPLSESLQILHDRASGLDSQAVFKKHCG